MKRGEDIQQLRTEVEAAIRRPQPWLEKSLRSIGSMHDLRRTFCTVAVNIEGMPYAVVQQLMNHSQMGNVTARDGKPTKEALRKHMQELESEFLRYATALPQTKMEG